MLVRVRVGVAVGELVGVFVRVGVLVRVLVRVGVEVGVLVPVGVGVAAGGCQMPKRAEGLPPARENKPPAWSVVPLTASAYTRPFMPLPRADQDVPFHAAMLLAATPPAVPNRPPT